MSNPIVNSITFVGSAAQQATIQAQGVGGNLIFQLPNTPPQVGQLMAATAINGSNVILGWSSPSTAGVVIRSATITLTGSQIANLNTVHPQILPAPGAGLVYNFVSSFWSYRYGTTPFTVAPNDGSGTITIVPAANPSGFYYTAVSLGPLASGELDLTAATSQTDMGGAPYGGDTAAHTVNQPIVVGLQTSTIGGAGDGTLKIVVYYTIETA